MQNKVKNNYYLMLLSIIVNNFGDVLFDLFIVWKITQKSGNVLNAVYLIGSSILFRAVLALFIGILVDHKNKKNLIIISNFSSSIIVIFFAIFFNFILANIWLGLFFILLNDINNEIFSRSHLLLGSEIFNQELFIKFQAKYTIINRIVSIIGASIIGILMELVHDQVIFAIDIITFVISAGSVYFVRYECKKQHDKIKKTATVLEGLKTDLKTMFKEMTHNSFIVKFIILMFVLNLAYGYIPYIFPVKIANEISSASYLGFIKAGISIGEIIGLLLVTKRGYHVSFLFKLSMIGNAICILLLYGVRSESIVLLLFTLYGLLDSITQPLFSYTVTIIDSSVRGKVLGGIDTIILLSPSIGMYLITKLMNLSKLVGYLSLVAIFIVGFLIIQFSKELTKITVDKEEVDENE